MKSKRYTQASKLAAIKNVYTKNLLYFAAHFSVARFLDKIP
jgi:hypothetical protein